VPFDAFGAPRAIAFSCLRSRACFWTLWRSILRLCGSWWGLPVKSLGSPAARTEQGLAIQGA